MYRDNIPETELPRLREQVRQLQSQLYGTQDQLKKSEEDLKKAREIHHRRWWNLALVVLGAIPPALVLRFHVPSRVLILDVLFFALWIWFLLRANRRG